MDRQPDGWTDRHWTDRRMEGQDRHDLDTLQLVCTTGSPPATCQHDWDPPQRFCTTNPLQHFCTTAPLQRFCMPRTLRNVSTRLDPSAMFPQGYQARRLSPGDDTSTGNQRSIAPQLPTLPRAG
eukprot:351397-Chlamydomonas_euryale.AAC.4